MPRQLFFFVLLYHVLLRLFVLDYLSWFFLCFYNIEMEGISVPASLIRRKI